MGYRSPTASIRSNHLTQAWTDLHEHFNECATGCLGLLAFLSEMPGVLFAEAADDITQGDRRDDQFDAGYLELLIQITGSPKSGCPGEPAYEFGPMIVGDDEGEMRTALPVAPWAVDPPCPFQLQPGMRVQIDLNVDSFRWCTPDDGYHGGSIARGLRCR